MSWNRSLNGVVTTRTNQEPREWDFNTEDFTNAGLEGNTTDTLAWLSFSQLWSFYPAYNVTAVVRREDTYSSWVIADSARGGLQQLVDGQKWESWPTRSITVTLALHFCSLGTHASLPADVKQRYASAAMILDMEKSENPLSQFLVRLLGETIAFELKLEGNIYPITPDAYFSSLAELAEWSGRETEHLMRLLLDALRAFLAVRGMIRGWLPVSRALDVSRAALDVAVQRDARASGIDFDRYCATFDLPRCVLDAIAHDASVFRRQREVAAVCRECRTPSFRRAAAAAVEHDVYRPALNWDTVSMEYVGQRHIFDGLKQKDKLRRLGIVKAQKPNVWLFFGPSGHGKTELAKLLPRLFFGVPEPERTGELLVLSMANYGTKETVYSLVDPPAAHVGDGMLLTALHKCQTAVIVLDEFEKSDSTAVQHVWLNAFHRHGSLQSLKSADRTVTTTNATFILTTNLCADAIKQGREEYLIASPDRQTEMRSAWSAECRRLIVQRYGEPLAARVDDFFPFVPYTEEEKQDVVRNRLMAYTLEQMKSGRRLFFCESVVSHLSKSMTNFHLSSVESIVIPTLVEMVEGGKTLGIVAMAQSRVVGAPDLCMIDLATVNPGDIETLMNCCCDTPDTQAAAAASDAAMTHSSENEEGAVDASPPLRLSNQFRGSHCGASGDATPAACSGNSASHSAGDRDSQLQLETEHDVHLAKVQRDLQVSRESQLQAQRERDLSVANEMAMKQQLLATERLVAMLKEKERQHERDLAASKQLVLELEERLVAVAADRDMERAALQSQLSTATSMATTKAAELQLTQQDLQVALSQNASMQRVTAVAVGVTVVLGVMAYGALTVLLAPEILLALAVTACLALVAGVVLFPHVIKNVLFFLYRILGAKGVAAVGFAGLACYLLPDYLPGRCACDARSVAK